MTNNYNVEDIARFINRKMDSAEAAAFEQTLQQDPALADEVAVQRKLSRLVQIASIKQKLDGVHQDYMLEETRPIPAGGNRKIPGIWGWAIAAAAIAGIIVLLFRPDPSPNDKLFALHFKDDAGLPSLMGETTTPLDEAMVYYKSGNYQESAVKFKHILSNNPGNDTLKYYEALCQVRLKNEPEALALLSSISFPSGSEWDIKAKWYTALVLIHQKRSKEAMSILEGTKKAGSLYAGESARLLEELKVTDH